MVYQIIHLFAMKESQDMIDCFMLIQGKPQGLSEGFFLCPFLCPVHPTSFCDEPKVTMYRDEVGQPSMPVYPVTPTARFSYKQSAIVCNSVIHRIVCCSDPWYCSAVTVQR